MTDIPETLHPLTGDHPSSQVRAVQDDISKRLQIRQVNKVLHGFPSPLLWDVAAIPVRDVVAEWDQRQSHDKHPLAVYVATPYCLPTNPGKCGYCLFPVEEYTGDRQLRTYLDYLAREGELYAPQLTNAEPSSVYFGGGTSNLYRADQYPRVMDLVRQVFPHLSESAEITLEGIPQLFTREKLVAMQQAGINRISMGAQQLDDELNRLSGRKQTPQQVLQAVSWCQELGLGVNVDLIFGWPRQTIASMLAGLELLVQTGIERITHYELNLGGATDFALNRRDELPSLEQTRQMYCESGACLRSHGFRQLTPYEWQKADSARPPAPYEECARGFDAQSVFGWGFAGMSDFGGNRTSPGAVYVNHRRVDRYFASLEAGEFPVERGFQREEDDLRLTLLFRNLQGLSLDLDGYQQAFGGNLLEEFAPIWSAAYDRNWIELENRQLRLVGDGPYYAPLIQELLGAERNGQLKERQFRALTQIDR